jgi:signal transduction histidine kinase
MMLFGNRRAREWLFLPESFGRYADRMPVGDRRLDDIRNAVAALGRTPELRLVIQKALETAEDRRAELMPQGPQGIRLNVVASWLTAPPVGDLLVVLSDVTDLRRLESARKDLVANVSHDLKTPVGAIRALAESLGYTIAPEADTVSDFSRRIVQETDRLTNLIDEILQLSRLESGADSMDIRPADLMDTARKAVEWIKPLADAKRVNISIASSGDTTVAHDQARIQRSITSILDNAVKFSFAESTVEIEIAGTAHDVSVKVTDHGEGMPKEVVERIFERFYRAEGSRQPRGSGLGLSIVKHTVGAHGGTVFASSELGNGSTIGFTLPRETRP